MYPSGNLFDFFRDKTIDLLGLGVSHGELALMLSGRCARLTVRDRRGFGELPADIRDSIADKGAVFKLGEGYLDDIDSDIVFRSPGISFLTPQLVEAGKRGVAIVSESELFLAHCPCPVIGITGSDGKTTTTTLISELLKAAGKRVFLGGNIGLPLLPMLSDIGPHDYAVVELSSFQLLSFRHSPDVAVVTNLAPNHLDIHRDMDEYIAAKENILSHQHGLSRTVLSFDNDITRSMAPKVRGDLRFFSRHNAVTRGAYMDERGDIWHSEGGKVVFVMNRSLIRIPGLHNVENFLAAISACWGIVEVADIQKVAESFGGVEHRIEFVREIDGAKYYNDSIATSPSRVMAGLRAFDTKLIVIAGGYDKKIPFEPLAPLLCERAKMLILSGPTADKIEAAVKGCPDYKENAPIILRAESMEAATRLAHQNARPGDIITLSPACASFDSYPNFEARGRHFKDIVNSL